MASTGRGPPSSTLTDRGTMTVDAANGGVRALLRARGGGPGGGGRPGPAGGGHAPRHAGVPRRRLDHAGDGLRRHTTPGRSWRRRTRSTYDAASCRRVLAPSCRGHGVIPPSVVPTMQQYAGRLGDVVVVMAGYDDIDISAGVDAVLAEAARQGVQRVLWLDFPTNVPYHQPLSSANVAPIYQRHNAVLAAKAAANPMLAIAPWAAYSAGHPEWFQPDGIHLRFPPGADDAGPLHRGPARGAAAAALHEPPRRRPGRRARRRPGGEGTRGEAGAGDAARPDPRHPRRRRRRLHRARRRRPVAARAARRQRAPRPRS